MTLFDEDKDKRPRVPETLFDEVKDNNEDKSFSENLAEKLGILE